MSDKDSSGGHEGHRPQTGGLVRSRRRVGRRYILAGLGACVVGAYYAARRYGGELHLAATFLPPAPANQGSTRRLDLAPRPQGALTGSAFAAATHALTGFAREDAIANEILSGNVPEFLRQLLPVRMTRHKNLGAPRDPKAPANPAAGDEAVIWVTPDYLAIGTDQDFLRVPLMATTAQKLADRMDCTLPTRAIVDAVYARATVKLEPLALETNADMVTTDGYALHQMKIEEQRLGKGGALGALTAGHKKDIVLSTQLATRPDHVAIYGMHRNGEPIQALSSIHELAYVDYAHGARLVHGDMLIGAQKQRVVAVLTDPDLCSLLSDEGVFANVRYPLHG